MAPKHSKNRRGRVPTLKDACIFPLTLEREARVALDRIAADRNVSTAALIRDVLAKFIDREARR